MLGLKVIVADKYVSKEAYTKLYDEYTKLDKEKKEVDDKVNELKEDLKNVIEHALQKEESAAKNFEKVISFLETPDAKLSLARRIISTMDSKTMEELKQILISRLRKLSAFHKKTKNSHASLKGNDTRGETNVP